MRAGVARAIGGQNSRFVRDRRLEAAARSASDLAELRLYQARKNSRSVGEVAEMLGVKPATVLRYSYPRGGHAPALPAVTVGGERRFRLVDVEDYETRRDAHRAKVAAWRQDCAVRRAERNEIARYRRTLAHRDPTSIYRVQRGDLFRLVRDGAQTLVRVATVRPANSGLALSLDPVLDPEADGLTVYASRDGSHPDLRPVADAA